MLGSWSSAQGPVGPWWLVLSPLDQGHVWAQPPPPGHLTPLSPGATLSLSHLPHTSLNPHSKGLINASDRDSNEQLREDRLMHVLSPTVPALVLKTLPLLKSGAF